MANSASRALRRFFIGADIMTSAARPSIYKLGLYRDRSEKAYGTCHAIVTFKEVNKSRLIGNSLLMKSSNRWLLSMVLETGVPIALTLTLSWSVDMQMIGSN